MYTSELLEKYPYFSEKLKDNRLENILDPLTGVVSRAYIIGFAQSLIEQGIPFSFAILDLDNFKFINDTYGHRAGDSVLRSVAQGLADFLTEDGIVGRFGGDEILFVNLHAITYDERKAFFTRLYGSDTVLRRNIVLEDCSPFVTGTVGCASFPSDASDYDSLFSLIDKTLYRGKTKGRNCYIIYLEEKHRDIEIKRIAKHGICTSLQSLIRQFELVPGLVNKLHSVMPLLMEELRITELYYSGRDGVMHAVIDSKFRARADDIFRLMKDDVYFTNSVDGIEAHAPIFCASLRSINVETILVARVGMNMDTDGYIICAEPRSHRIWQEDERALLYFLAKLIASDIRIEGETLE